MMTRRGLWILTVVFFSFFSISTISSAMLVIRRPGFALPMIAVNLLMLALFLWARRSIKRRMKRGGWFA